MKLATPTLAAAIATAFAVSAWASSSSDENAGPVPDDVAKAIEAVVTAEGYELRSIEMESDEIEVYAIRDGQLWELEIDPDSGTILEAELED